MRKQSSKKAQYECTIIGGGSGGLVSALYFGSYKRETILINSGIPRAARIPRIRNLVGFAEGLTGRAHLIKLRKQASLVKTDFFIGLAVIYPRLRQNLFEIPIEFKTSFAQKVFLATGMRDLQPAVPNNEKLRSSGLLAYCQICDSSGSSLA